LEILHGQVFVFPLPLLWRLCNCIGCATLERE